jgi:hypothetical protein
VYPAGDRLHRRTNYRCPNPRTNNGTNNGTNNSAYDI